MLRLEHQRKRGFLGWWITAAAFVTSGLAVGVPYYNVPFFYDYFARTNGWSRAEITLGFPLAALLTLWMGPLVVPRFSPRKMIVAGSALTALSLVGFARMGSGLPVYYALWVVFTAGYIFSGPIPHQLIVSHWFRRNRGKAMGIVYVGNGLMGSVGSLLVQPLTERFGFRAALMILAAIVMICWPVAILFLRDKPAEVGQFPDGDVVAPAEATAIPHSFGFLMRNYGFWLLLIGSFCAIGAVGAINFHMKFVFLDQGFTKGPVADSTWRTASVLILWSSVVGRLAVGALADRFPKKWVMTGTFALVAATIPDLLLVRPGHVGSAVHLRCPVRIWIGRRLHADSVNGGRAVRRQQPEPRAGGDFTGEHDRADVASVFCFDFARADGKLFGGDGRGSGGRGGRSGCDRDSSEEKPMARKS